MFDLPKYGKGVCLARLAELLAALDVDRERLARQSVVVTGSNGKGSTSAFAASIAQAYGLKTGLFTSPHLLRFNERFKINGADIGDDDLARLVARIETAIADISRRSGAQFGSFEALFVLACLYFQESACDFMVFEAGIGGRYDPARLVGARFTCVTSLDYEHVELLGPTLELICSDKSDACAAGGTIVYGENCRPLAPHIAEYNRNRAVTALFVREEIGISGERVSAGRQHFDFRFGTYAFASLDMHVLGTFQFNNAATATALFLLWLGDQPSNVTPARIEAAVRSGLGAARWPGRLEVIQSDPLTVIDVGHTPDGIRQSLESLKAIHGPDNWILVTGVSFNKSAGEIVAALAPSFDTIICTSAHHKGAPAETIAAAARAAHPATDLRLTANIEEAVRLSQSLAASHKRKIYVAGGLFLAIEYSAALRGERAEDLKFF